MSDQPTPLPPERIEEIERRVNAATPGPWTQATDEGGPDCYVLSLGPEKELLIECLDGPHDAEFVAHARTDVPALLAEVERQAGEIEMLKVAIHEGREKWTRALNGKAEAEAARDLLQSRLDALPGKIMDAMDGMMDQAATAWAVDGTPFVESVNTQIRSLVDAEVDNLKAQICALKFEREMGGRHV